MPRWSHLCRTQLLMSGADKPDDMGLMRKIGPLPAADAGKLRVAAVAPTFFDLNGNALERGIEGQDRQ
jgi:hypothetical protein